MKNETNKVKNTQIKIEHKHVLINDANTSNSKTTTPRFNSDNWNANGRNESTMRLKYCGIDFLAHKRTYCDIIPSTDGPSFPNNNGSSSSFMMGMIPQLFFTDDVVLKQSPDLPPWNLLAHAYKYDSNVLLLHTNDLSSNKRDLQKKSIQHLSNMISNEVGIESGSFVLRYVRDGDTLFHIACRLLEGKPYSKQTFSKTKTSSNSSK